MFATERLVLRGFEDSDLDDLFALRNDPRVMRWGRDPVTPRPTKYKKFLKTRAENTTIWFTIVLKGTGEFIGYCNIRWMEPIKNRDGALGISIIPKFWGKGYGTEAATFTVDHAFRALGVQRVSLNVFEGNAAAITVYKKIGFKEEGRKRRANWVDGHWEDLLSMGVLDEEWAESIKSTIIRPLDKAFRDYLDSDGVFVPEGSDNTPVGSSLSDNEDGDEDSIDDAAVGRSFSFPDLDERIRQTIREYDAVFPKLNFSSPKDASWVLPPSSPLKCTSPSDVYLLLKSSDFVSSDLSIDAVFEGCQYDQSDPPSYQLELVLRKWYPMDSSREFRCFVRDGCFIGISQRDTNFYDFMNELQTRQKIIGALERLWEDNIKSKWHGQQDYIFDVLMTRDLSRGHILDFNPYAARTDPLLFTYEELFSVFNSRSSTPDLRVIDSPLHPAATRNAPAHQHNMLPIEALAFSSGRDIDEFSNLWQKEIQRSTSNNND